MPADFQTLAQRQATVLFEELAEREPPDVEGATAFVTALFSGGLERLPAALR